MVKGTLLTESLKIGAVLDVAGLRLTRVSRRDVSASVSEVQPPVWTFLEFEADDDAVGPLAESLARALLADGGWYADFGAGLDHVVVFAARSSATGAATRAAAPKPWTMARRWASRITSWTGQTDPIIDPNALSAADQCVPARRVVMLTKRPSPWAERAMVVNPSTTQTRLPCGRHGRPVSAGKRTNENLT